MSWLAQQGLFFQQFPCVFQSSCGDILATQHPGNFLLAVLCAQRQNGRLGSTICHVLGNAEMMPAEFGDLRKMGDADNLVMRCQVRQFAAASVAVT